MSENATEMTATTTTMLLLLLLASPALATTPTPSPTSTPPEWPSKYTVSGLLVIPFAEIEEPFAAFYDSGAGKSRLDTYGGMDRTFQRADLDTAFKVVPFTDEEAENKVGCFAVNGTKKAPVEVQSVLPDLRGFVLKGES